MAAYLKIQSTDVNTVYVKKLVKENPDFNISNIFEYLLQPPCLYRTTLARQAVFNNDEELLDYLINENVDLNVCSISGTALHAATMKKNFECIKKLHRAGANLNVPQGYDLVTPLIIAVGQGEFETVKYLIENGADIHAETSLRSVHFYGHTPILIASCKGYDNIVELLLQNGADPCGEISKSNLNVDAVKNILRTSPNININSFFIGRRYIHRATTLAHLAIQFENMELLDYLIESNADLNINVPRQGTVLHVAVKAGNLDLVKKLCKSGADVNVKMIVSFEGSITPLILAILEGFLEIAEYLIRHGADVNVAITNMQENVARTGFTALHFAVRRDYKEIIKLLLEKNANPNAKSKRNSTPLTIGYKLGDFETIKMLIAHADAIYDSNVIREVSLNENPEVFDHILALDIDSIDKYLADDQPKNHIFHHIYNNMSVFLCHQRVDRCCIKNILDAGANINSVNDRNELAVEIFKNPRLPVLLEYIEQHIVKLQQAGIYVCLRNIEAVKEGYENYRTDCNQEIEKLKTDKIGSSNSTFHDVLNRGFHSLAIRFMHTNIDAIVDKNKLSNAYPIYGGMIYYKLAKAQRRIPLLKSVEEFLDYVLNYCLKLPYTFTRELYLYLTNNDLKQLL